MLNAFRFFFLFFLSPSLLTSIFKIRSHYIYIRSNKKERKKKKRYTAALIIWSDISSNYHVELLKILTVPQNRPGQEMSASLADHTCPSTNQQPTH